MHVLEEAKKYRCILVGAMVYLLIIIGIVWIAPLVLLEWITRSSSNPIVTLWSVGILLASVIYMLFKISETVRIQITPLSITFDSNRAARACAFSLPYQAIGGLLLIGVIGVLYTRSLCQQPVVLVTAIKNGVEDSISPGDRFNVTTSENSILFHASTLTPTAISCRWDYTGDAIRLIGQQTGCDAWFTFSGKQNDIAAVTLNAITGQCSQENIFPFFVEIK